MNDLVKRLRGTYSMGPFGDRSFAEFIPPIQVEAAERIEYLEKIVSKLSNVLDKLVRDERK